MTLPLELAGIQDPNVRRAFEQIANAFPVSSQNVPGWLYAEVVTSETTASLSYVDLTTVGPQVTAPLAGDYMIAIGALVSNDTINGFAIASPKLGGAATADNDSVSFAVSATNQPVYLYREIKRTLAAGTLVKAQYRAGGGGTAAFSRRTLAILPVRV